MSHYRKAPVTRPSDRPLAFVWLKYTAEMMVLLDGEPMAFVAAAEIITSERAFRSRAAAAPCPAFATGKPLGGWHPAMPPPASDRAALRTFAMALSRDD